ncbi:hypothetical protein [Rhodopirellula baltica]
MTETNPYEPTIVETEPQSANPHSASVRTEAWRGFKLGARLTGIAVTSLMVLIALFAVGMFVYMTVTTSGDFLNAVSWIEVFKFIGGSFATILMMSVYGGTTGAIVMALAAVIRKLRHSPC